MSPNPETHKQLAVHFFSASSKWLVWLKKNFSQTESVWIKLAKKGSGIKSLSYEEAREGAIRFGWIDGLINKYDEAFYLIKFSPRRKRSNWSKINRGIAEQLIENNKMEPSGLVQVDAAKSDGRWDAAYDSQSTIEVPNELQILLDKNPLANRRFSELNSSNRYAFLYRIQNAKRLETKQRHIQKTIAMLERGETYHPSANK